MKQKRNVILITVIIVILIFLISCAVIIFTKGNERIYTGDNMYGYSLQVGIGGKSYDSPRSAIKDCHKEFDEGQVLYTGTAGNYVLVFWQDRGRIVGEEVLKEGNDDYYYIGNCGVIFAAGNQNMEQGFEETVKADVEQMVKLHTDLLKLNEKYKALPVWGVAKEGKVEQILINGEKVEICKPFSYEGKKYYMWYISDFTGYSENMEITLEYGGN